MVFNIDKESMAMTSKSGHRDGKMTSGSIGDGAAKPIHFFKIMLPNTHLDGKMRIPEKFVRKYGELLGNPVFLKLPNRAEWKINLEKRNDEIWFHKGWKKFVEDLSLAYGHMLVFRYEGTSHFHVLIFDMSAMEIDYPLNKVDGKRARSNEEIQPSKTRRTNGIGSSKVKSNSNLHDTAIYQTVNNCKGMTLASMGKVKNPNEGKRSSDQHTETSTFSNCGARITDSNNSFKLIIKSYHQLTKSDMYLPRSFFNGNITNNVRQNVTLMVDERSWSVDFVQYKRYSQTEYQRKRCSQTHLGRGWLDFARDNNLEVGDACLFKVEDSNDGMVMKVSISKHSSLLNKAISGH